MQAEAGLGDEFDDETQVNKSYYDLVGVMKFMESHLPEGSYFNDWQEFEHPQLGAFWAYHLHSVDGPEVERTKHSG